jgi:hypothetical protein
LTAVSFAPPKVSHELRDETRRREQHAFLGLVTDDGSDWWRGWNRDLEHFCTGMRLVFCPDPCPVEAVAMGARPGRWGILVPSMLGGPVSVKAFAGPNDERVEPGSWVFEMLRSHDWGDPRVRRDRARAAEEAARATERRKQAERDARDEEVLERYLAGTRTQVSMNPDTAWGQNARGARLMRGERRRS